MKSLLLLVMLAAATLTVLGGATARLGSRTSVDRRGYARIVSVSYAARTVR